MVLRRLVSNSLKSLKKLHKISRSYDEIFTIKKSVDRFKYLCIIIFGNPSLTTNVLQNVYQPQCKRCKIFLKIYEIY
ncbi:hypothetical protein Anas_02893 [Armadillidium nasatum]|uniref:Uncharacterized protein n=1 Tax=Armadillidium nasatum TaxID=96803 RepID=A0A5N5TGJ7_9CRUS|nr:hypothetical protein Anas_02893 [Armadillidium nasatum]